MRFFTRQHFPSVAAIPPIFLALFMLALPARANPLLWTGGGGANVNWNNPANWGSVGIPGNGDTLIFQGATGLLNSNNIPNLILNQIRFLNGGFDLRGDNFTLTNSILCTNTTGVNTIECTNINLATNDIVITVSNGVSLIIGSQLSGAVGVVKTGLGTLTYQYLLGNNIYTGTTLVAEGTLVLNVGGGSAYRGPLVIGTGSGLGNPTVKLGQDFEIPDIVPVTINFGTLDLNGYNDIIGTNLTMSGGTVQTGIGVLMVLLDTTVTVFNTCTINGNVEFGPISYLLNVPGGGTLNMNAAMSGGGSITKTGTGNLYFFGTNSYTGLTTVSAGWLWAETPLA